MQTMLSAIEKLESGSYIVQLPELVLVLIQCFNPCVDGGAESTVPISSLCILHTTSREFVRKGKRAVSPRWRKSLSRIFGLWGRPTRPRTAATSARRTDSAQSRAELVASAALRRTSSSRSSDLS